MSKACVDETTTARARIDYNAGDDLHETREHQYPFTDSESRTADKTEDFALALALPWVDVLVFVKGIVGTLRRVGTEQRALGSG